MPADNKLAPPAVTLTMAVDMQLRVPVELLEKQLGENWRDQLDELGIGTFGTLQLISTKPVELVSYCTQQYVDLHKENT